MPGRRKSRQPRLQSPSRHVRALTGGKGSLVRALLDFVLFRLHRKAQRYFGRRAHKKWPAETRRPLLGVGGPGVGAANKAASVIRAACRAVHRTPHADRTLVGPVHRTPHADRTLVGPDARLVLMMTCGCKCERA